LRGAYSPVWAMAAGRRTGADGRRARMEMTLAEAAAAIGGSLSEGASASARPSGVSIDSRTIAEGEIFFAVAGPRFDGHDFVQDAFAAGAICSVVNRGRKDAVPEGRPAILVEDTVGALQRLASYYREKLGCDVVAVTGSNGKTSTKDLVAHVLAGSRLVGGTRGNLNNYLGVPLTLLSLPEGCEVAVVEMGASRKGEIRRLARIASPRLGTITNVGPAHLEEMGTVEAVARTKAELAEELPPGGTVVANGDDALLMEAVRSVLRSDIRLVRCGFGPGNDVRAVSFESSGERGVKFTVDGLGEASLQAIGKHSVYNALMAVAVGLEFGMAFEEIRDRLASFEPPPLRLRPRRAGEVVILDDSYNSNPASAAAALAALREYPCSAKRVAVFGDMLELGEESARLHRELGRRAAFVDRLMAVGEWAGETVRGAVAGGMPPARASAFEDKGSLFAALAGCLESGDVVLVKGSRGAAMEEIVEKLEDMLGGEPAE